MAKKSKGKTSQKSGGVCLWKRRRGCRRLWLPDVKSQLIGKDSDAGKD